jgi:hypothetical protein
MELREHRCKYIALAQGLVNDVRDGMTECAMGVRPSRPKAPTGSPYAGVQVLLGLVTINAHLAGNEVKDVPVEPELWVRDAGDSLGTDQ